MLWRVTMQPEVEQRCPVPSLVIRKRADIQRGMPILIWTVTPSTPLGVYFT